MNGTKLGAAVAFLALMTIGSGAHAFGNACKNVNFSVDNEFEVNGQPHSLTVERFELFSASEGRWLNENFADVFVPANARDRAVRWGETVEYAENDRITQIRVHFRYVFDNDPDGPGETFHASFTDTSITDPVCVAGRWYNPTIALKMFH
jgi:hypothetical protein